MHRGPAFGGRSKASASTLCQKCLKKGHYSYECTVTAQERPYKPRPSRTQQLMNPDLKPKLNTEVPEDLLPKKGIADELLAKKDEERGRKPRRDTDKSHRNRSWSASSSGSDSVSTISTNRSRSRSPPPKRRERNEKGSLRGGAMADPPKKRERSVSSDSFTSGEGRERNVRRRMSSFSPQERGRSRRSGSGFGLGPEPGKRTARRSPSPSRSTSRRRAPSRSPIGGRGKRTVRSPSRGSDRMETSEERSPLQSRPGRYASVSRSPSPGRGRAKLPPRDLRSQSPYSRRGRGPPRSPSPLKPRNNGPARHLPPGGQDRQPSVRQPEQIKRPVPAPAPPRERSLSPYSKRVALTRGG